MTGTDVIWNEKCSMTIARAENCSILLNILLQNAMQGFELTIARIIFNQFIYMNLLNEPVHYNKALQHWKKNTL